MKNSKYLRKNKGSVALFIMLSFLFFLVIVVSMTVYVSNKKSAVENEYEQIRKNYEQDVGNEGAIYNSIK